MMHMAARIALSIYKGLNLLCHFLSGYRDGQILQNGKSRLIFGIRILWVNVLRNFRKLRSLPLNFYDVDLVSCA